MNPTERPSPRRRAASWFNAAVLALALTACAVLAVLITTRAKVQFDRTATREHQLSERTRLVLSRLDRDLHLIVAADPGALDRATYQRTQDVLEKFQRAGGRLKVDFIRTSDPQGQAAYDRVLTDLVRRDRPLIDASLAQLNACLARVEASVQAIDAVQQSLLKVREQGSGGGQLSDQFLQTEAAVLRVAVEGLREGATKARAGLVPTAPEGQAPPIDRALADLKPPVSEAAKALGDLAPQLESVTAGAQASEAEKGAAAPVLARLRAARDATGSLSADLEAVEVPRVLKVARGLQLRQAALLIDEAAQPGAGLGVTAIDADALLGVGAQGLDLRARTEDLIAGAVATMSSGVRPVVCIVHGVPRRLASVDWPLMQRLRQQLSMRAIDIVEWPTALEREMPTTVAADSPSRPVVFVTLTAQASGRESSQAVAGGIASFSAALNRLVSEGRSVLLSVNLSQVAASGSQDPLTECLKPLGVEVDSARPLLQSEKVETRTVARPRLDLLDPHASHALSGAIKGLRLRLQWPLSITASGSVAGVRTEPVVSVRTGDSGGPIWAESEWLEFYRAVSQTKGDYTRVLNPPAKDSPRDASAPGAAWTLALAVERDLPGRPRQRVVVVGANGWYLDDLTAAQAEIEGRIVPLFPGNLQLAESTVHWLAGQDDQLLRSATVSAAATIPALTPAQQAWLRWLLIAIMPALALAAGAVYRVLRP
ncbi:MAG: hypothetical protein K2Q09_10125 [Phycisphaerales bacterium]|nr:hypothetical protein [Phycisphaerales bacterium]